MRLFASPPYADRFWDLAAWASAGRWVAHPGREPIPTRQPRADRLSDYDAWREVCQWAAENLPADATVLTPRMSQTFKWYARRSEAGTWKEVPQNARGIVQWYGRMNEFYGTGRSEPSLRWYNALEQLGARSSAALAAKEHFQYVLTTVSSTLLSGPLEPIHWNPTYVIYRVVLFLGPFTGTVPIFAAKPAKMGCPPRPFRGAAPREEPVNDLRAVVFDMDGLMFNTKDLYSLAGSELLRRRGLEFSADLKDAMMGLPPRASFETHDPAARLAGVLGRAGRRVERNFPRPTARAHGHDARTGRVARCPGAGERSQGHCHQHRAAADRRLPGAVGSGAAVPVRAHVRRHHPRQAASGNLSDRRQRFGVSPPQMLVLEDSQNGCRAGAAAGAGGGGAGPP